MPESKNGSGDRVVVDSRVTFTARDDDHFLPSSLESTLIYPSIADTNSIGYTRGPSSTVLFRYLNCFCLFPLFPAFVSKCCRKYMAHDWRVRSPLQQKKRSIRWCGTINQRTISCRSTGHNGEQHLGPLEEDSSM